MKKTFTLFFALMCLGITNIFAVSYLYQEPNEQSYSAPNGNSWSTPEFQGPASQLSFEAAKGGLWAVGDIVITQLVNGEWKSVTTVMPSGNYKKYESFGPFDLDKNATQIRFYSNGSYDRYIKNIQVSMLSYSHAPEHSGWEPTALIGSEDSYGETTLEWSDVAPFELSLSGEGASQFTYGIVNNSAVGNYGTATISATYKHNEVGVHNAVLTISNGSSTYEISLQGTTTKKDQTINWTDECLLGKLPVGKEIENPAASTSELLLTYTSSNDSVVAIINDGTGIRALAAGQATIYAYQAGDEVWNEVSDSITLLVTEKQIQVIHWADNLTNLKVGGDVVVLTAAAQLLVNAETGETMDAPERTALISYSSADENVVAVNGNELTIVGEGETTIIATLPGDDDFEATTMTMPVRVRVPSTACETYVLSAPDEFSQEYSVFWQERIYEPAEFSGPAHILTFEARKNNSTAVGNIEIQQYVNGEWQTIDDANPGTDWREYNYELDRNATKIRFYNGYGSYKRYFKNVLVTQATYLETTTPAVIVEQSNIGDVINQTIAIQYSNLPEGVTISHLSEQIQLSDNGFVTTCGEYGEKLITLTAQPSAIGTIEDEITIYDEVTGLTLTIPVAIHTQPYAQTIIWEDDLSSVSVFDTVMLNAVAMTDITYAVSDDAIASVEGNVLVFHNAGEVVVYAYAAEADLYKADTLAKTIVVEPIYQEIVWNVETLEMAVGETLHLDAVATSGLEVSYILDVDTVAVLDGNLLIAQMPGEVVVTAVQEGNNNYFYVEMSYQITVVEEGDGDVSTGNENVVKGEQLKVRKIVRDGMILIQKGDEVYSILGHRL